MDKELKVSLYTAYLKEEGYKPELDADGDVRFKMEGLAYFIDVDERDDAYFRICLPNFWEIESDGEREKVLVACDFANERSKVAKVFTVRNWVWASIELFVPEPETFKVLFPRCMSALHNAVRNFAENVREGTEQTEKD